MPKMEYLKREDDGTVYAFRCSECGASSKIYQNRTHKDGCSALRPAWIWIRERQKADARINELFDTIGKLMYLEELLAAYKN